MIVPLGASAIVITNDTTIGPTNTAYENLDLVVSNAVLTVDGPHAFNSLRVAAGATLNHSPVGSGTLPFVAGITNEVHVLTGTNAVTLGQANPIPGSVFVVDTNGLAYTNEADYVLSSIETALLVQRTTNSLIPDGGLVLVSYDYQTTVRAGLDLVVATDVEIEPGARVDGNARGYAGGLGPGAGGSTGSPLSGGGAGHGGFGGLSSANAAGGLAYDSALNATNAGSGGGAGLGGSGGAGGGRIQFRTGGHFILNGSVTADGQNATNSRAGGGAGGGISIIAMQSFTGTGTLSARGGTGEPIHGGGGGGGRIALTIGTNSFTGDVQVNGGGGWQRGGAGTFRLLEGNGPGFVTIDNAGLTGASTPLDLVAPFSGAVEVRGRAAAVVGASVQYSLGSLVVRSNSTLTTTATNNATLSLFLTGDFQLEAGAVLSLDGKGFPPGSGPGAGGTGQVGGGAGHAGYGGSGVTPTNSGAGGTYYDSLSSPGMAGSGGRSVGLHPAGAGGGVVLLTVNGELRLDGSISAAAAAGSGLGGGGSGGTVRLTLGTFSGNGSVSANGGAGGAPGNGGGGGAGGRIAITCATNLFTGSLTAYGGVGGMNGAAGTIYTRLNQVPYGDFRADNGGILSGTNTLVDGASGLNVSIANGARVRCNVTSLLLGELNIGTNSTFLLGDGRGQVTLTVASNAIVAMGGVISGDGSVTGGGTGPGQSSSAGASGAGHGGYGGRGAGVATGGNAYNSTASPSGMGSVGGTGVGVGGAGGGSIRMTVSGPLVLDGKMSVNGLGSTNLNSGGGSGGSVWLTVNNTFSGSGLISAEGGNGNNAGGGGAGGRIAVYWNSNAFSGTYSSKGGAGFGAGAAGTIYLNRNNGPYGSLVVDNGGLAGTNTTFDLISLSNLTVRAGGAITTSTSGLTIRGNLELDSNATWRVGSSTLTISGSVNIASDASLSADAVSSFGSGSGQGSSLGSGGGGHGGYGGRGLGRTGGNAYDSTAQPSMTGSPGGYYTFPQPLGGGMIRMTVAGPMTLNGRISANGGSAVTNNAGGGSGGSVYLTVNNLLIGTGTISADGGNGLLPNNGGGGGGRIAIYFQSNSFTGTISAKGGTGYQAGGAGTIYLKRNSSQLPDLLADNGGLSGTNTTFDLASVSNLTISGGARLRPNSSLSVNTLTILTNSALLTAVSSSGTLNLSLSSAANIAEGSVILAEGQGGGNGFGQTSSVGSGGGGHSGYGGRGAGAAGGNAYGSLASPTSNGSVGGGGQSGGAGGGVIAINVVGSQPTVPITLDGRISASGLNAVSNNAGGGSGGSISISLGQNGLLQGAGQITADGGSGHLPNGGGGGGGRIALSQSSSRTTNAFLGNISARGGNGFMRGGAGTVYLFTNSAAPVVIVDNGGARGTNSSVAGTSGFDLHVQGGALAMNLGTPRDLFLRTNSAVVQTGNLIVTRNATFDAGGGINLDGVSDFKAGNGATSSTPKGGAGHGGLGALNPGNFGAVYDFVSNPTSSGSVGGNGSGTSSAPLGGFGGGATHLIVSNTLTLDGEISADGASGDFNSGGGSGGSVWLEALTLAGNGAITANGGSGNGTAGGGGGGRIAIYSTTNLFAGTVSACGGGGAAAGGAGTVFWRNNSLLTSLLLDNCGVPGTNTPLSSAFGLATNLAVSGGAVGEFQGTIPTFSNLVVGTGGWVTARRADTNLNLALLGDLIVHPGGGLGMDGKGYARGIGPGAGGSLYNQGAGGSYGGWGGSSASGAFSGPDYGSASKPVDRGSGGGNGLGPVTGGSDGGGAIRLAVAGSLLLGGLISADGSDGWQDDSGGGAGGSIWISARKFTGAGELAARGGDGDFYNGGGGGGGRIAVYSPMNTFTGLVSVAGGEGAFAGEAGTVFTSGTFPGLEVLSQSPTGVVADAVSEVSLEFSEALNPPSIATNDFRLYAPGGALAASNFTWSLPGPATLRLQFPLQTTPGNYRLEVGPLIEGFLAPRMSQVYTGWFTAAPPLLSGRVLDTNGLPVVGVALQPSGGLPVALTDGTGQYSIPVPMAWSGTVTPALGGFQFAPGARGYASVAGSVPNQDYVMLETIGAPLQVRADAGNLFFQWRAWPGVTYQIYSTTNLSPAVWTPFSAPIPGTNGVMAASFSIGLQPEMYFRLQAQNW